MQGANKGAAMVVKRNVWQQHIREATTQAFPKYPCPRCADGHLRVRVDGFQLVETEASKKARDFEEWEPEWIEERFTALLDCDEANCGELVVIAGDSVVMPIEDEDGEGFGWGLASMLRPRSMVPAAPIIPISTKLPASVSSELRLAFGLYWVDFGACISRLRTSLENLLDEKLISREGTKGNGDTYRLTLNKRIELYEQQYTDSASAESMQALRVVGNLGAHGDHVSQENLFDALDVYEDALLEIYEQKTAKLAAKKAALKLLT